MKRSTDRILTTHVGSLPRPVDLLEMNDAKGSGRSIDQSAWAARVKTAVLEIVRLQRECGVDIVNDGELSKSSWSSYVNERLSGFAESVSRGQGSLAKGRDKRTFQEFYDEYDRIQPFRTVNGSRWTDVICHAPILYKGQDAVQMDIEDLQTACAGVAAEEAFITAVAPGSIITRRINQYYPSEEAFLFAIADAMKTEYQAIVGAGFVLQIDDPQLVTRYDMEDPPPDAAQYRKLAAARVEALNHGGRIFLSDLRHRAGTQRADPVPRRQSQNSRGRTVQLSISPHSHIEPSLRTDGRFDVHHVRRPAG